MDNLKKDLDLLENLSKKISDLIYHNDFSQISFIDAQRRALIERIRESEIPKNNIKILAVKSFILTLILKHLSHTERFIPLNPSW